MEHDEVSTYYQGIEQAYGGPVEYRTFTSFFREEEGKILSTSGLLCIVNGVIFFEDFEKSRNGILDLISSGRRSAYKKFKVERSLEEVESCAVVSSAAAASFLLGRTHRDNIPALTKIQRIIGKNRFHIRFKRSGDWILEPLDTRQLIKYLEEHA